MPTGVGAHEKSARSWRALFVIECCGSVRGYFSVRFVRAAAANIETPAAPDASAISSAIVLLEL